MYRSLAGSIDQLTVNVNVDVSPLSLDEREILHEYYLANSTVLDKTDSRMERNNNLFHLLCRRQVPKEMFFKKMFFC